ncbi:MAG: rhodanese-like domain-containing protein [Cyanobacteriota bacterium]|nr:rhodanese-like domain-containing protein [Cyanobacteriota bacterium]
MFNFIPKPPPLEPKSHAYELKRRLDWGEPALTIVDARDRVAFNTSHISGAISLPLEEMPSNALQCLELDRDIYIYANTDEETAVAATQLREANFRNVSELRGGVAGWKAFGYPVVSN